MSSLKHLEPIIENALDEYSRFPSFNVSCRQSDEDLLADINHFISPNKQQLLRE